MADIDPKGLPGLCGRYVVLSLQVEALRSGRSLGSASRRLRKHACDMQAVNVKRVYRLYHEMGLQLRNKTPKRRVKAKLREDRQLPQGANETWAMDFVHDQLAMGRKAAHLDRG